MDGGSIPPRSTTLKVDESQQKQAIATGNSDCGFFRSDTQLVSDSPKWATKWHNFDTFLPSSENNIGTRECYSFRKKIFERHRHSSFARVDVAFVERLRMVGEDVS